MTVRGRRSLTLRERVAYRLSTARGVPIEHDLRPYESTLRTIKGTCLETESDASLFRMASQLRSRLQSGSDPAAELPECFALAAEASRRRLGMRPFDGQLIAGIVMQHGKLVQMPTGEGKTLAAVFPACHAALRGRHVHVLTANDYLARRDAQWMGPIYDLLGISVASIAADATPAQRRAAYQAGVTYLTAREAGFDYLRDGLCVCSADLVQGPLETAIVDEADFLLIDEARVPLVIAGATELDGVDPLRADRVCRDMRRGIDYSVDREGRRIEILPAGHRMIEAAFGVAGIHEAQHHSIRRLLRKYSLLVELDRRRVRALRDAALHGAELPDLVEENLSSSDHRASAASAWVALLDSFWADHLLLVEEVREGIHLERYAGREPGLEYIHRVGAAFDNGLAAVEETIAAACARLPEDPDALSFDGLGINAPSSTWTYQIDDEAPIRFSIVSAMGSGIGEALATGPIMVMESLARIFARMRRGRAPASPSGR